MAPSARCDAHSQKDTFQKPEKKDPLTQKKVRAVNEEVKVVWDMDKEQWRSFRWDSVYDAYRFPLGNGEDAQV